MTARINRSDERIKTGGAPEERGDRGLNDDAGQDEREGTGLVSDDFENFLENEFSQTALPTPPALRGYHLAWLTTISQYDSLQKRMRLGYAPVKQSEMASFDANGGQTMAGHESHITCNEMILCKIPEDRYQQIMSFYHHKKPMQEEEGVVQKFKEQGQRLGDADDGVDEIERRLAAERKKNPIFS